VGPAAGPPPRSLTSKHIGDWIGIVFLSLLVGGIAFGILAVGYAIFMYFLGGTPTLTFREAWEVVTRRR
jgi:hypothetical protein